MENSTSGKTAVEMQVRIATKMVHWPTGPIPSCDLHAKQLIGLARFLESSVVVTACTDKLECLNCRQHGAIFDIEGRTLGLVSPAPSLQALAAVAGEPKDPSSMAEFRQAVQGLVDEGRLIVHASRAAMSVASRKTAWMIMIDLDGVEHFLTIQHGNCRWTTGEDAALRMAREADALAVLTLVGTGTKARAEEREFF